MKRRVITQEKTKCEACDGTGKQWCDGPSELGPGPYPCYRCEGKGWYWKEVKKK